MIKVELGHAEAAISDYDMAISLDPENILAWGNRSFANIKIGQYFESISDSETVIRLDPNEARAYHEQRSRQN